MKAESGWKNNVNGGNEFEFTALPGGYRHFRSYFENIGDIGYWWTATKTGDAFAQYLRMHYNFDSVIEGIDDQRVGFSVRCVAND